MNRETIDHIKTIAVASNLLYIMACDGKSVDVGRAERDHISDALKEIERLLADEREAVVKAAELCRKREVKAEREKVRELCAKYLEGEAARDATLAEAGTPFKTLGQAMLMVAAQRIRQLDLTAPSSREEG